MSRPKNPLDVLQAMVNGILIETGRALRGSDKDGGRTLANTSTRLRSMVPPAIDSFHQALDDIEGEIIRAKAVLLRDLEELRSKRYALENPPVQVVEPAREPSVEVEISAEDNKMGDNQPSPLIKEEFSKPDTVSAQSETEDPPKEGIAKILEDVKAIQGPSPPSSVENGMKLEPVGLDINAIGAANATPPQASAAIEDTIESLFDAQDSGNNNTTPDLNFDGMDFLNDSATQNTSQTQNNVFDLSSFGNNPQDFNMSDLQGSSGAQNTTNVGGNAEDDLFGMINTSDGGDLMDLDANIRPAEESSFDDMFFMQDEGGLNGGGEMEHGDFDDAFFGLDQE